MIYFFVRSITQSPFVVYFKGTMASKTENGVESTTPVDKTTPAALPSQATRVRVQPDEWNQMLSSSVDFGVPTSATMLDEKTLTHMLRRAGVLKGKDVVAAVTCTRAPKQGLLSELSFFEVEYTCSDMEVEQNGLVKKGNVAKEVTELPRKLAGKFPVEGGNSGGGFETESIVYRGMPDGILERRPRVYFCDRNCVIMEQLQGVSCDLFEEQPPARVRATLQSLARLHAAFWGGKEAHDVMHTLPHRRQLRDVFATAMRGDGLGEDGKTKMPVTPYATLHSLFPEINEMQPGLLDAAAVRVTAILDALYPQNGTVQSSAQVDTVPSTFIYGDIKADNTFEMGQGAECDLEMAFVDFAGVGWGPPNDDLVFYLAISLSPEAYGHNWEKYLRYYYKALIAEGVDAQREWSWEAARADYVRRIGVTLLVTGAFLAKRLGDGHADPEVDMQHPEKVHAHRLTKLIVTRVAAACKIHDYVSYIKSLPLDSSDSPN